MDYNKTGALAPALLFKVCIKKTVYNSGIKKVLTAGRRSVIFAVSK